MHSVSDLFIEGLLQHFSTNKINLVHNCNKTKVALPRLFHNLSEVQSDLLSADNDLLIIDFYYPDLIRK